MPSNIKFPISITQKGTVLLVHFLKKKTGNGKSPMASVYFFL